MSSHDGGDASPDLHTLSGAYAVHALPDDEREVFEAHHQVCDACTQEVPELVATAARLGATEETAPPAQLRAAVLAGLSDVRQEPPTPPPADDPDDLLLSRPRPWVIWLLLVVAAAIGIARRGPW